MNEEEKQLSQAIDKWLKACKESPSNNQLECKIGSVTQKEVLEAKKAGFEISGYWKRIVSFEKNHITKRHGDKKSEALQGQIAMDDEQIKRGLILSKNPDYATKDDDDKQKKNGHIRYKTFTMDQKDGGEFQTINQVSRKKNKLTIFSMIKTQRPKKKKGNQK